MSKLGVSILSLVVFAAPIMACALPAMAMTQAERECCKRMAQECGKHGMPQSHSCCQTTSAPDRLPAIKTSSETNSKHLTLIVLHAPPAMLTAATTFEPVIPQWASDAHSPPISPRDTIFVLRI